MKTVAFLLNSYHNGGPSNVVTEIIHNINYNNYRIIVITFLNNNSSVYIENITSREITIIELNYKTKKEALVKGVGVVRKLIRQLKIDILHSNSILTDTISVMADNYVAKICTLHNNMFDNYPYFYGNFKGKLFIRFHLFVLGKMNHCVCCSKSIYEALTPELDNTIIIKNGIKLRKDSSEFSRKTIGIPENAIVYLYVGVLNGRKNVEWMIDQFLDNHLCNEYLLIAGKGPAYNICMKKTTEYVRLLGFIDNPFPLYGISDIYLSASLAEGYSLSVLEAVCSGNILLLSDIPAHKEVLEDLGNSSWCSLFKLDFNSFRDAMLNIRGKLEISNRKEITEQANMKFNSLIMTKKYAEVYDSL